MFRKESLSLLIVLIFYFQRSSVCVLPSHCLPHTHTCQTPLAAHICLHFCSVTTLALVSVVLEFVAAILVFQIRQFFERQFLIMIIISEPSFCIDMWGCLNKENPYKEKLLKKRRKHLSAEKQSVTGAHSSTPLSKP